MNIFISDISSWTCEDLQNDADKTGREFPQVYYIIIRYRFKESNMTIGQETKESSTNIRKKTWGNSGGFKEEILWKTSIITDKQDYRDCLPDDIRQPEQRGNPLLSLVKNTADASKAAAWILPGCETPTINCRASVPPQRHQENSSKILSVTHRPVFHHLKQMNKKTDKAMLKHVLSLIRNFFLNILHTIILFVIFANSFRKEHQTGNEVQNKL